ncbi:MAG: Na/Pi cotransporter family protein [Clostridia bacterium]|nr:Na/Pi cotransporter family protein [Clostridia bacterium]
MEIFDVFTLLGGLAFFLFGMNVMSSGLEQLAGSKLEELLRKMTSNRFKALLLGVGVTAIIQSSSAVTVMLVGLVNSGIMQLGQSIGVIMGSNIGTTVTAWLISMTGIEGDSFWIQMLKPSSFAPLLALLGIGLMMMAKSNKKKSIGSILLGFAVLMNGMELMSGAVEPLKDSPAFAKVFTLFSNPLLGVLVGAVFTAIIQSSSASVGILQSLTATGAITFGNAIPIIMGQNIGTCITALISSVGVNRNAKRVSIVHISFNLIGTAVWLSLFYIVHLIVDFSFIDQPINAAWIAIIHSIFNILTTLLLLPFTKLLEKLAYIIIKEKGKKAEEASFLDERLLNTPSIAVSECNAKTVEMSHVAFATLNDSFALMEQYTSARCDAVLAGEDRLDKYEDKLGSYLVKIATKEISDADSRQVSRMLHTIGNFERLGDHAVNLMGVAKEMHEKQISFSDEANREIAVLRRALNEILARTEEAYDKNDSALAARVEPLEQVIDLLIADIKNRHIARLKNGYCTIELGFVLSDLLTNYERISDHCSNIAVAIIESEQGSFDTHEYLAAVKEGSGTGFHDEFERCKAEYRL